MVDGEKQERQPSAARDPLHGVTLERLVRHLHSEYGWEELARRIPVKCFQANPSVGSSLKFLRKVGWAREQVEGEYLKLVRREDANPLIAALKAGTLSADLPAPSQTRAHEALAWALRHGAAEADLRTLMAFVQDVNFWPERERLPLLNLAIDRDAPPAFVRELLKQGADANDPRYWPPLLHTVDVEGLAYQTGRRAPRTDVLDLLLSHGAHPDASDKRGHTALDLARAYGLKAVLNKLGPAAP
ncbi:VF530 family DNA-binding protein [Deinococcus multiflagellatus]|uniref:VF530 family DNA-binding protein n=1 Tax=Deinococcus multiflagellatus TaxID=1656887 RepID=UPI001CCFE91E|nr:VF530 family DNA-binding protein [Deinococcus multiflagellatus]MBZ9713884.1 VF530 family DNA-binding protein [Deinococcus multiflagellatus]